MLAVRTAIGAKTPLPTDSDSKGSQGATTPNLSPTVVKETGRSRFHGHEEQRW